MKKGRSEFLIWFAVISVLHFLVYWLLGLVVITSEWGPSALVLALCVKGLSFPLGWILHSSDTQQLSVWASYYLEFLNSAIWGAIIAFVICLMKERRSKLDAL